MTLRHMSHSEYSRRKIWLNAKLWMLRFRIGMGSFRSTHLKVSDTSKVLDQLRSELAAQQKQDALLTREDDLLLALKTLDFTRSPFFIH